MRGAAAHYPSNADDIGEIRLSLHAAFLDSAADVDVVVEQRSGTSTVDRFGDPIEDLPRRERVEALAATQLAPQVARYRELWGRLLQEDP